MSSLTTLVLGCAFWVFAFGWLFRRLGKNPATKQIRDGSVVKLLTSIFGMK